MWKLSWSRRSRTTVRQPPRRPPTDPRGRQAGGLRGEAIAAAHLERLGWTVLARRVKIGRDEIDLVALEPGEGEGSGKVVFVEVRSHATSRFGTPEEGVGRAKVLRLCRSAAALRALGQLPDGRPLPRLPWRIDLLAVEQGPSLAPGVGGPIVRHIRGLEL